MQQKNISMETFEKMALEMGCSVASKTDPLYSEGYSITFSSRTPKQSAQKDIVSLPSISENASDSAKQKLNFLQKD